MGAMLIANNRSGMAAWSSDARHWGELDCHGSICIAGGRGAEGGPREDNGGVGFSTS
jgi:hypothetical protein